MDDPVRHLALAPRETATSYVSRLAAANWVNAATLAIDKETTFRHVIDGAPEAFEEMADFGVTVPPDVLAWSAIKRDGHQREFRGHFFPSKVLQVPQMRGCPLCLKADASRARGKPHLAMAMRGHWLVPHVTLCLEHEHPLVPLWQDPAPYTRLDSAVHLSKLAKRILAGAFDQDLRDPTDFDVWLDGRLSENHTDGWLDTHPLHTAATFCYLLGTALLRLEGVLPSWVGRSDRWALYQMGFDVARHGVDAIKQSLLKLQLLPGGPHDGPKKIFPYLYDRLSHDYQDDPSFEPFREILHDHMVNTWPLGVGDEVLGRPVMERRLHSVRTAAQATGVDQRRMRKMLAAAGIVPEADTGLPDSWEVFEVSKAQAILDELTTLVPAKTFAALIGASRSQFDLLVRDGVLVPALERADVKAVWNPADGVAFLAGLLAGAVPISVALHGWEHLSKSAQRLKIGPGAIIDAIRSGRITRIAKHADHEGYAAVYVDHAEVEGVLGAEPPKAQSIELFAKSVGLLPPSRLKRLIQNGETPATTLINPKTKAEQQYITTADAEAFHRLFLTTRTVALEFKRSWQSISAELRAKGVAPFSPGGEDYGNLYLRADVMAAIR
jgi:TniQ